MELAAKYVYKIYETGSFSAAARALYISQPSLSATVNRYEGELGFRIFDRGTKHISLTAEGRIFIEALDEIVKAEAKMHSRIRSLSRDSESTVRIGAPGYSSYFLIAEAVERFSRLYPNARIEVDLSNSGAALPLNDRLRKKELELVVGYYPTENLFNSTFLLTEHLLIGVRRSLIENEELLSYARSYSEILSGQDTTLTPTRLLRTLSYVPFGNQSATHHKMQELLGEFKTVRCTPKNFNHSGLHYILMNEGVGACLVADLHVLKNKAADDVVFFRPDSPLATRDIYVYGCKSASSENKTAEHFADVLRNVCNDLAERLTPVQSRRKRLEL